MKFVFEGPFSMIPRQLMRKCGYHEFVDPNTKKVSYSRTLQSGQHYPRWHAYVEATENYGVIVDLHLDQKKPSYAGTRAHAGEYEGEHVTAEMTRIYNVLLKCKQ